MYISPFDFCVHLIILLFLLLDELGCTLVHIINLRVGNCTP